MVRSFSGGEFVGGKVVSWWRVHSWRDSLVARLPGGKVTVILHLQCLLGDHSSSKPVMQSKFS